MTLGRSQLPGGPHDGLFMMQIPLPARFTESWVKRESGADGSE